MRQKARVEMEYRIFRCVRGCIPELYFFIELEHEWCFIMEYLNGGTLEDCLKLDGKLPESEYQEILAESVAAVIQFHSYGFVHCDLKPSNIIFDSKGRARLIDFHYALCLKECPQSSPSGGTFPYQAPEAFNHSPCSYANDWWVTGLIACVTTYNNLHALGVQ
jgi:serine/threonine protein kinase